MAAGWFALGVVDALPVRLRRMQNTCSRSFMQWAAISCGRFLRAAGVLCAIHAMYDSRTCNACTMLQSSASTPGCMLLGAAQHTWHHSGLYTFSEALGLSKVSLSAAQVAC
jgi:hypothetical protein